MTLTGLASNGVANTSERRADGSFILATGEFESLVGNDDLIEAKDLELMSE